MSDKKSFFSNSFDKNKQKPVVTEPLADVEVNKTIKEIHNVDIARLTLDIPQALHKKVKIRATELGISIKDYAISLFEKDLMK